MNSCYINSVACVSAQNTLRNDHFLEEVVFYDENIISAINPVYKEYIPPAAARRMAKGVKIGVVASAMALKEAYVTIPDAIITGTGMGCLQDSEKFVSSMITNDEQFLTPTSFIQSTHNTVGAQIALGLQCKAYNFSYVNGAVSFESCLIDAQLMFQEQEVKHILVGGVDEHGAHTNNLHKLIGHIKKEPVSTVQLLNSKTPGTIFGEGASFFLLSDKKEHGSYGKLVDVEIINTIKLENIINRVLHFLNRNGISVEDIDAVILGNNGDVEFDNYYNKLQDGLFKNTQQLAYKHLFGEYNTVSATGFWVGAKILKSQTVPNVLKINNKRSNSYKNILLYNQYRGENHSFVLLQSC